MGSQGTLLVKRFTTSRQWLVLCGLLTLLSAAPNHDFHFSRTDVHWNQETLTLQATARVFTDDLEVAIRHHAGLDDTHPIWLGDDHEWTSADQTIAAWLEQHITFHVDDTPVEMAWVGKEIELDVSYLYLESPPVSGRGATWRVTNRLFFHEFADQVNEVYLQGIDTTGRAAEKREMLNWELPTMVWESVSLETDATDD